MNVATRWPLFRDAVRAITIRVRGRLREQLRSGSASH
jgi:hypothetical protein